MGRGYLLAPLTHLSLGDEVCPVQRSTATSQELSDPVLLHTPDPQEKGFAA